MPRGTQRGLGAQPERMREHPLPSGNGRALGRIRSTGNGHQAGTAGGVTSGSALLNLLPAVAEAFYQQVPLVIISADRPQAWIDQLDGQTLPQPDALGRFVRYAANLPEPTDDTQHWYCNRLVNEALLGV